MKILFLFVMMFIWGIQPLVMISMLIMITLIYSLIMMLNMGSYWFSYMLMLIMLSGILVMFTYMVSLIPNESFEMMGVIYLSMIMFMFLMMKINIKMIIMEDFSEMVLKYWNNELSVYNIYLLIFLFMVMLMVIWLSKLNEGALRNF